jgi:hypothetical protein
MERAARVGAAVGRATQIRADALEAVRWSRGGTYRLGLDDHLNWWACRRGEGGWVTAGRLVGLPARVAVVSYRRRLALRRRRAPR